MAPSWGRKSIKNRSKKASKKRWKNGRHQDGQKVATRDSNYPRGGGSRALGRCPPKGLANPSPPGRRISSSTLFHTFPFQSLPFLFLSLPFPSLPFSSLVLACLGLSWLDFPSQLGPNLAPKIHQNPLKIDAKMPSQVDLIF